MTTTHPAAAVRTEPSPTSWLPLIVLLSGTFLVGLDFYIVNVALPSIQAGLSASPAVLEWLVAGYGLTYGSLLIAASALGERWGRRTTFIAGVLVFVAASALCGLVPDVAALIAGRLLQGAGAALLTPMVLALLNEVYDGPRRLRALGIYATFLALPAVSGQLIGGLLIRADIAGLGWRAIFLVNVPVGLVVAVVAPRILPRSRANGTKALDLPSLGLVVGAATGILLPLLEGRQLGWPAWTWISLAGGLLLALLVLWRSRALADAGLTPLIDPAALRSASVRRGLLGQALLFLGMASYFLVLAMYLQQGHGLSPLASGLVFTILAAAYVVGARCVEALNARLGRMTLPVAALAFTVGHLTLFAAVELHGTTGSVLWLAPGLVVTGLAMGVCLRALIATVMGGVEPRHAAAVSGVLSAVQQLSNSLGVALIGLVFFGPANLDHAFARSLLALAAGTTALAAVTALGTRRPSAAR